MVPGNAIIPGIMKVTLGRTGLTVGKNGFGALPIQRIPAADAAHLLQKALDNGFDFVDTARFYTDSEAKIGAALADRRDSFVLATKTGATTAERFWQDLETSLGLLKTDHVDIYQFHNLPFVPQPDGADGLYAAMLQARAQGKIRFIGLTNHRLPLAQEAVRSGLYETLQFPFSYLSSEAEQNLVRECAERNVGFISMKALAGGLITDAHLAYAFQASFPGALPIWGIQRERELDAFISAARQEAALSDADWMKIEADRKQLAGEFCRGCGYCMPCPEGIAINDCARMTLLLSRAPHAVYLTEDYHRKMEQITHCRRCGQCVKRCPYHLDTPSLLQANLADFRRAWAARANG